MKNCLIEICCKYPYNIASFFCSKINSIFGINNSEKNQNKEFSSIPNIETNDIKNPAKILSSEEINEMINDQIKYSKEQTNSNGYKIIKQKNNDDMPKAGELLNLEEIKNEINQIEFEEEEQKKKNKKEKNKDKGINNKDKEEEKNKENNNEENNEEDEDDININIEELRKDVLESNDD